MKLIKLTKMEAFQRSDDGSGRSSEVKFLPSNPIWIKPDNIEEMETVNGVTSIRLSVGHMPSRMSSGSIVVKEMPEEIIALSDAIA
jgi:hypothetical protein